MPRFPLARSFSPLGYKPKLGLGLVVQVAHSEKKKYVA